MQKQHEEQNLSAKAQKEDESRPSLLDRLKALELLAQNLDSRISVLEKVEVRINGKASDG